MVIARSVEDIAYRPASIVTVGTFDGVHRGHAAIIQQVVRRAKETGARSVIVTFEPHPREVVGQGPVELLTTLEERLEFIGALGADAIVVLPFTYEFSRLTPNEFYETIMVKAIGVSEVIEGTDHMFGRDREANIETLKALGSRFGFRVTAAVTVLDNGEPISSSRIRAALKEGNVEAAEELLDRPYGLRGTVVAGDGRGAQLGYPTANVQPASAKKIVPANGVYVAGVEIGNELRYGMLNIGVRPTLTSGSERVVEVHVFELNEDLYGKQLRIQFLKRLRNEIKFSSKEELVDQLRRDRSESLKFVEALQSQYE
ncbi:MAG TPA: bifunctional riboflavin kinase/FAD synthetase [Bacteroidota bacterium]|nr:bifunctional riboflavin kinase/FAD synthetase [Bacteroidota bacterium]